MAKRSYRNADIEAVRELYLDGHGSGRWIADYLKIPKSTVADWIRSFKDEKIAEPGTGAKPAVSYEESVTNQDIKTLLKKKTLYDHIGDAFITATERLKPSRQSKLSPILKHDKEELCLIFSDSQIGELINPAETGGLGNYSTEIFLQRLDFFMDSLNKIFNIHMQEVPYKRINVFFLGDIIEGSTIFEGQLRSIDRTTVEQIIIAVDAIHKFVAWLADTFEEVGCYCVVGNHGRIGKKGVNSPMDNLDYLSYKWMQERLADFDNVEVHVADTWWMAVERMTTRFVLVHGDDIRGWMGYPFYGAGKSEGKMQKLLGINFQYYVIGHHHQPAEFSNILSNGCWTGGSELSLKVMQVGGHPTQTLFSLHPTFGVTWKRNVMLYDPKKTSKVKVYS